MANNLVVVAAVDAFRNLLKTMGGIRSAPDEPPEIINTEFTLVTTATEVEYSDISSGTLNLFVTLQAGVYSPRKNAQYDHAKMLPYVDLIRDKVFADANKNLSNTISQVRAGANATIGPVDYAGATVYGVTFRYPVKIGCKWDSTNGYYIKG